MTPWPRVWNGGPAEPVGAPALVVEFDVKTKSEANERGFWAATNRKKKQDSALELALAEALVSSPIPAEGPWCLRLTRLAPGRLDDDNLGSAFKRIRDRMAEIVGVKDNDPRIAFTVAQERRKGTPGVRVEVWGPDGFPRGEGGHWLVNGTCRCGQRSTDEPRRCPA
jgi:hypothetical protein